jgi:hypothetical protein
LHTFFVASAIFKDAAGWQIYQALLCAPLEKVGYGGSSIQYPASQIFLKYVISGNVVMEIMDILENKKAARYGRRIYL